MAKSKHSRGPWKVHPKSKRKVQGPDGEVICSVGRAEKVSSEVYETYCANAVLIAKSPDMHAQLERVLAWFADWQIEIGPAEQALLDPINDLLGNEAVTSR